MAVTLDPNALVTLADAKDHLNIPSANLDFDDRVKRYINSATFEIENFLDRKIIKRTYIEYQDGRNSNRIVLKNWPADKPSELRIDPESVFTDPSTLIDSGDYEIDNDSMVVMPNRLFSKGTRNIKVVYEAGFTTVPWPIQTACLWLVAWDYDIQSDRRVGNKSKEKNNEQTDYHEDWPPWLIRRLMPYRRFEWPIANAPTENR